MPDLTPEQAFEAAADSVARRQREFAASGIDFEKFLPKAKSAEPGEIHLPDVDTMPLAEEEPSCPDCHGRGWATDPDTRTVTACDCRQRRWASPEAVPSAELEARGVDPKVSRRLKSHWNPKYEPWPQEADAWPSGMAVGRGNAEEGERPAWLYLWGPTGSGKSAVAAWIMRRAMVNGAACRWIPIRKAIRDTQGKIGSNVPAPVWQWLRYPFVVLEEVGAQRLDLAYHEDLLAQWVEERHTLAGGFQVVTSNLTPRQLPDVVPPRVASRVLDGVVKKMAGPDARRRVWRFALADSIREGK